MHFAYVLARPDYFERGHIGSVTHAKGIAEGLAKLVDLDIYSSPSSDDYIQSEKITYYKIAGQLFWQLALLAALFKNRKKYDFVIVRYSASMGLFHCLVLNLLFKSHWGFELNSLGYQQVNFSRGFKALLGQFILKPVERLIMRFTPYVNCVSQNLVDEIAKYAKYTFALPNASYPIDVDINRCSDGPVKIIYFGMYRDYYELISLAEDVNGLDEVELHFYGAGEQEKDLLAINKNSHNVHVHGRYKFTDLVSSGIFNGNTFLALPYKLGTIADYGSPTKLFEYLALGLPIISTKVSQPFELLSDLLCDVPDSVFFYDQSVKEIIEDVRNQGDFDREKVISYFKNNHTWDMRAKVYLESICNKIDQI